MRGDSRDRLLCKRVSARRFGLDAQLGGIAPFVPFELALVVGNAAGLLVTLQGRHAKPSRGIRGLESMRHLLREEPQGLAFHPTLPGIRFARLDREPFADDASD